MRLNYFLPSLLAVGALAASIKVPALNLLNQTSTPIDLLTLDVKSLSEMLNNGSMTSVKIVDLYLKQIEKHNNRGINLRAVIEVAPYDSLMAIAKQLDLERAAGKIRGPMHGIPILIKDNVGTDVSLGMNTTAGSLALLGSRVPRDAHIIKLLREAGAIVLAKTNLSEWANYRGGNKNGWSARGGQTQSAYVVGGFAAGGDPSGSSSGSAVGTSAGFGPISIGSETDGSIIGPSNRGSLFGLKPTVGRTSRAGIIPISAVQDSAGPMGKSTYDVATLLTIISAGGPDPRDIYTFLAPNVTTDFVSAIKPSGEGFKGVKIGIPYATFYDSNATGLDQLVYDATYDALTKISGLGATVINNTNLPSATDILGYRAGNESIVLSYTFKEDIATYLADLTWESDVAPLKTLADLINFNDKNAAAEMPVGQCCQEIFIEAVQTTGRNSSIYIDALAADVFNGDKNGLGFIFDKYDLDVVAIPSEVATSPAAIVGWPIATVPLGYFPLSSATPGQPFGLAFIARPFQEAKLIQVMAAFEEAFPARRVPLQLQYN